MIGGSHVFDVGDDVCSQAESRAGVGQAGDGVELGVADLMVEFPVREEVWLSTVELGEGFEDGFVDVHCSLASPQDEERLGIFVNERRE